MSYCEEALDWVREVHGQKPEFIQAVEEVFETLDRVVDSDTWYRRERILERLASPERVITFRVVWENDDGGVEVNLGYRVQFHTQLGPAKGGLRFHRSVNSSILHFLAFEQSFKNALTGIALGAGKGGSDFDPRGRSDREVMRFCQSFMTELARYIGSDRDVPAGDIGVGRREIGYLHGQYRRITGRWEGVLTGKGPEWGGSLFREDATGYGTVHFVDLMLKADEDELNGKRVAVSGSGNVALFATQTAMERGASVISVSDSNGTLHFKNGISDDDLVALRKLKNEQRGRLSEFSTGDGVEYLAGQNPWTLECDVALPCATQNELQKDDAEALVGNGCRYVAEGANMPTTPEALSVLTNGGVRVGPGKAANAGGVAVSGLEMHQNATFRAWPRHQVRSELDRIMENIHDTAARRARAHGLDGNLIFGANVAGFERLALAIREQGLF